MIKHTSTIDSLTLIQFKSNVDQRVSGSDEEHVFILLNLSDRAVFDHVCYADPLKFFVSALESWIYGIVKCYYIIRLWIPRLDF
jgi:hypothetical protein